MDGSEFERTMTLEEQELWDRFETGSPKERKQARDLLRSKYHVKPGELREKDGR